MIFYSQQTRGFYDEAIHGVRGAPGCLIPNDAVEVDEATHAQMLEGQATGKEVVPGPDGAPVLRDVVLTAEQQQAACVAAVQDELDRQAKAKGYDNIVSACSYAAQASGAPFQAEGAAFLSWRSQVWTQAYAKLAQVQAGTIPMPTPAEAVADMPALVLPS